MVRIKRYLLLLYCIFIQSSVLAEQKSVELIVCFINNSLNCLFQPPFSLVSTNNINSMIFTFNDVDIVVEGDTFAASNWGLVFTSPGAGGGGASGEFYCDAKNCQNNAIEITANNGNIRVVSINTVNHLMGQLEVTLSKFKNGILPPNLQSLINSSNGRMIVSATYKESDDPNHLPARSQGYLWQPDQGAFANAPVLSVFARSNGFVVNIDKPADLSSVNQSPQSSETVPAVPVNLVPEAKGHVSGYLLAYWLERDVDGFEPCANNWVFGPNPISYNNSYGVIPTLACTFASYVDSNGIGGTNNDLGCTFQTPPLPIAPYLLPAPELPPLTADLVAVPTPFVDFESKSKTLQTLMANPIQEFPIAGSCLTLVYVPATQSSFGKMGVQNGQIYGVTAWLLNSSFTKADPTPNLSLAHSNLSFITSGSFPLASLAKNPKLSLNTTDCFVATAASGAIDSKSVFYWRILRDTYLTRLGITDFYYRHGPKWADWLNAHPKYKPPVNFVLEKTGAFFYFTSLYAQKAFDFTSKQAKIIFSKLSDIWVQKAAADDFWNSQEPQDLSIKIGNLTNYDFAITGGIALPTADKDLYKIYYPRPSFDLEIASNYLYWTGDFGWAFGLKGMYETNTENSVDYLGLGNATQENERFLYFTSIEGVFGLRYRNVDFLFLQPGIFAGAGLLRLREEGKAKGDSGQNGTNDKSLIDGVTNYSAVFDFGANLDISLATIFFYSERELALSRDILLRLSGIYRLNPSRALSSTGVVFTAGFAFLF